MIVLLPAFLIILVALVLGHLRKEKLLTEYVALASRGLESGREASDEALRPLREYVLTESLRKGILATTVGLGLLLVPLLSGLVTEEGARSFLEIWGVVIAAYGVGSLIVWYAVDRPRLA